MAQEEEWHDDMREGIMRMLRSGEYNWPPTYADYLSNEDDNLIDDLCPWLIEEFEASMAEQRMRSMEDEEYMQLLAGLDLGTQHAGPQLLNYEDEWLQQLY